MHELRRAPRHGCDCASVCVCAVDANSDGKISFEEFVQIFEIAPDALPAGVKQLVGASVMVLDSLDALRSKMFPNDSAKENPTT